MIQEIAPKKFWNAYENRKPQDDSEIICVWDGNYCIIHGEQGDRFPRYEELLRENGVGSDYAELKNLQYLFAIFEGEARRDYFLCVCEKAYDFSTLNLS